MKRIYDLRGARKNLIKEINAEMALKKTAKTNKLLEKENEKELKPLIGKKIAARIDYISYPGPNFIDVIGILKSVDRESIIIEFDPAFKKALHRIEQRPINKSEIQTITEL